MTRANMSFAVGLLLTSTACSVGADGASSFGTGPASTSTAGTTGATAGTDGDSDTDAGVTSDGDGSTGAATTVGSTGGVDPTAGSTSGDPTSDGSTGGGTTAVGGGSTGGTSGAGTSGGGTTGGGTTGGGTTGGTTGASGGSTGGGALTPMAGGTCGGMTGYLAPNVTSPELHIFGVYEAQAGNAITVDVDRANVPLTLVLSSYESVTWTLNLGAGVILDEVILNGYEPQSVQGQGGATVTNRSGPGQYITACGYAWPGNNGGCNTPSLASGSESLTGLDLATFTGCYYGTTFSLE